MQRMATAPARPDLGAAAAPAHRPTIVLGLAAALAWVISAFPAYRAIGWFPPPRTLAILAAGVPLVLAAGIMLGRVAAGTARSAAGIVLVIGALVLPWVLTTSVPGVAHPQEIPLPGDPALALTAAPEGNFELWLMRGDADHVTRLTSTTAQELGADLSPDGSRVVFATDAAGTWDLSVMTLGDDGGPGPVARLTTREDADETAADWSPDGTRIAFAVDLGERGRDLAHGCGRIERAPDRLRAGLAPPRRAGRRTAPGSPSAPAVRTTRSTRISGSRTPTVPLPRT